jgi:Phasin protein
MSTQQFQPVTDIQENAMTDATERFRGAINANVEAARKCAILALEGTQKVFTLQAKTYQELCNGSAQQLKQMWSASTDPSQVAADWPKLFQDSMQKAVDITYDYLKTATEFQTELAHIIAEEQMPALNKQWLERMEGMLKTLEGMLESVEEIARAGIAITEGMSPRTAGPEHRTKKAA